MQIKDGVQLVGLQLVMRPVLIVCDKVYQTNGHDFVVTSGLEGTHWAGSLHYYGYAIDCRTRDIPANVLDIIIYKIREGLGVAYRVVQESNHLHIEYNLDRK